MNKVAKISITLTWVFQILTALIHSASFFVDQVPTNETERQLVELMQNYKADLGAGYHRTMEELFTSVSACLTLFCLFGGLMTRYLSKNIENTRILRGVMAINAFTFGIAFIVMLFFAFLPPRVCMGLIFFSALASTLSLKQKM